METVRDRLWTKAAKLKIPLTAAFELLPVCNLSCKMCYVRKDMAYVNDHGGLIPGERWLDWARQAAELGLLFPLLTGGEPFLHPDFWQIYQGLSELGMQTSINSNATLITRDVARRLGACRPTRVNITLYGASEESYQSLCGNGSAYGRVMDAVQYLREFDVPIKFNTSVTSHNVRDVEALIDYADSLGVPLQIASYMFPPLRRNSGMVGSNDRLPPEEAALVRVKSDFLRAEPGWFLGQAQRYSRFVPLEQLQDRERLPQKMRCRAGNSSAWVDWQGNLSNCGMYNSISIPLAGGTFSDAWDKVTEQTSQLTYHSFCSICPNQWLCNTCIAMVNNECGNGDGRPDYMCRMNQAAAEYYQEYAAKIPADVHCQEPDAMDFTTGCGVDIDEL